MSANDQLPSPFEFLKEDAIALSKVDLCEGTNTAEGYSIMLFGSGVKNPAVDGVLRENFFKLYDQYSITAKENIGW